MSHSLAIAAKEAQLFFKRALRNPKQLGAVLPSSRHLGALMAQNANLNGKAPIVELGGGTGALTKALLAAGVAPERLYVIELDKELYNYLKAKFPQVNVILGNAAELEKILPSHILGKIPVIISGLPMLNINKEIQKQILDSCFHVMEPQGRILQYTYVLHSPVHVQSLGLTKQRIGTVFLNVPPATVWKYSRKAA